MFKKITEKLTAHLKLNFSWEWMLGVDSGFVCNLLIFQVLLWIPVSSVTGALLITYGILWVIFGPYPLLIENRQASVTIGSGIIVFSGCCMIGLGIAMILQLMTEMDWVPRMAGILYGLAFFIWLFIILKMAPTINRYSLLCCRNRVYPCLQCTGSNQCTRYACASPNDTCGTGSSILYEWWGSSWLDALRYVEK